MTLLDRQIKALEETLDKVIEECERGQAHDWSNLNCPLCTEFGINCTTECPLDCLRLAEEQVVKTYSSAIPSDTPVIADFLYALLLYLKEDR